MADSKTTALTGFTPILTDLVYGVDDPGGTPVSGKVTFADARTLIEANLVQPIITVAAANTAALVSTGYSLTGSDATSMIDLAGTWNTTGTPTALKLNITDTASNSASLWLDIQKGGASVFSVGKTSFAGTKLDLVGTNSEIIASSLAGAPKIVFAPSGTFTYYSGATASLFHDTVKFKMPSAMNFGWAANPAGAASDTSLFRDAAGVIGQRVGTAAQEFRVWNTWSGFGANGEYGGFKWNSNVFEIGSVALGTGSLRGIMLGISGNSIGFVGATPVAQQAGTGLTTGFTAGSGTAANDDSTFTGNSGTKAYTVGDIVLALKNYGLLAAS